MELLETGKSPLREVAEKLELGHDIDALFEAADYSEGIIGDAKQALHKAVPLGDVDVDVILLGSYARREASASSDFDYLIVPHSLPSQDEIRRTRELVQAVDEFIEKLAQTEDETGARRPGASGLFGTIQSAADLVERIGLDQDTNATHTRRALLLQESVSIYDPDLHEKLVESVLARYLSDYEIPKNGPPRFLINDLNRYWFTVAVDYQAKRWERLGRGWGIRYLKLLVTRRLSYVAGILPLLLCSDQHPATIDRLVESYKKPALERIAGLVNIDEFEELDELGVVLVCAARFNEAISKGETRKILNNVRPDPAPGATPVFDELKELTVVLDEALRRMFSGSLLNSPVHKYLIL
jgi:predicted nucleotidyltransferase